MGGDTEWKCDCSANNVDSCVIWFDTMFGTKTYVNVHSAQEIGAWRDSRLKTTLAPVLRRTVPLLLLVGLIAIVSCSLSYDEKHPRCKSDSCKLVWQQVVAMSHVVSIVFTELFLGILWLHALYCVIHAMIVMYTADQEWQATHKGEKEKQGKQS